MSSLSVHAFVLGIEFLDEMCFPGLPILCICVEHFFQYCDLHVSNTVARQIEVLACCLIEMFVGNISSVFSKPC